MAEAIEAGTIVDADGVRAQLRNRWELASVLNFLRVFRPVIRRNLEVTAEEVEEALIRPNDVLARIHVALLKGIPPVNKNVEVPDMWVTLVCQQINMWWDWVGEGDAPLSVKRGDEVSMYKNLDPLSRLVILKAVCEIRAVQDDIIDHIDEALKNGSPLSQFCKDKIGRDSEGYDYWWDGDNVMGYRLYRGIMVPDTNQKLKGRSCSIEHINFTNETIACDLQQFHEISVKLSESKAYEDGKLANALETGVIPLVERFVKKQERALQRQQRVALQLTGFSEIAIGSRRSCRDRKPARYTFDEYDQSIDEALQIQRKRKASERDTGLGNEGHTTSQERGSESEKTMTSGSDEAGDRENGDADDSYSDDSDFQSDEELGDTVPKPTKPAKIIDTTGLRRSSRNTTYPDQANERPRQMPVHNTDCTMDTVPDSDYEDSEDEVAVMGKPVNELLHTVEGVSASAATVR